MMQNSKFYASGPSLTYQVLHNTVSIITEASRQIGSHSRAPQHKHDPHCTYRALPGSGRTLASADFCPRTDAGALDRRAKTRRSVRDFPHAPARSAQGSGVGRTGRTASRAAAATSPKFRRQDLDDIFPLMAMLEGRCAADAVRQAKPADIADLQRNPRTPRSLPQRAANRCLLRGQPGVPQAAFRNSPTTAGCFRSFRICARY